MIFLITFFFFTNTSFQILKRSAKTLGRDTFLARNALFLTELRCFKFPDLSTAQDQEKRSTNPV